MNNNQRRRMIWFEISKRKLIRENSKNAEATKNSNNTNTKLEITQNQNNEYKTNTNATKSNQTQNPTCYEDEDNFVNER